MDRFRMNGLARFLAVAVAVLLTSAFTAPLVHAVLPYSFARVFNRVLMGTALLALAVFVGIRRHTLTRFGLAWTPDSARFLRAGFLTGAAGLAIFVLMSVAAGHARIEIKQVPVLRWVERLAEGLLTGVLIGLIEEFFFRGFVFTSVRDSVARRRVWPAMMVTSLVYAVIHFASVRPPAVSADPGFTDSLRLMAAALRALADLPFAWPSVVGLFLFGMVLNICVVRSGSLYPSIGLHAGAVALLRTLGLFVSVQHDRTLLWGSARVYDGAIGWAWVLLMGLALARRLRRGAPPP
jgi:membrane protease YdiL (CAAX protease family)